MSVPACVTPGRTARRNLIPRAQLGRWTLALAGVLAAGGTSRAQVVVVNYGGDYGASNQPFTAAPQNQTGEFFGASGGHDSRVIVHFGTSTPLINLAGTSGKFYGGYESVNFGQGGPGPITPPFTGFTATQVTNSGSNDPIEMGTGPRNAPNNNGRFAGLFLWQKADFLNGANGQTLGIDSNSKISVSRVAGSGTIFRMTVLVRDGTTIYANQNQLDDSSGTVNQFLLGQNWAVYDPTNDTNTLEFNGPNNSAFGTFAPHTFTDITGVGLTWDLTGFFTGGSFPAGGNDFQVSTFSATLAVAPVPEPGSAGLCLVALTGFGLFRLRRRRLAAVASNAA